MITEVLLILSLYLTLFLTCWQFRPLIKAMADVESILNDDDFCRDIVDTPNEGIEQHRKRECLKSVIRKGKVYLLGSKWTHVKVDNASDETINKTYAEKTGKALSKLVINLYSTENSWVVKVRDAKKLWQDIENDPIIKDHMAKLGSL